MERAGKEVGGAARGACKITVVGTGSVGLAAAYAIFIKNLAKPLVLLDILEDKVAGEVEDFQHGLSFTESEGVIGGTDYRLSEGSRVCVITAGKRQSPGQTRSALMEGNVNIFKGILTKLHALSPQAFFIIASNPVDALTYAAWHLTNLPLNKIIGTGTNLDSSRFKYYISEFIGVPINNIEGYIIGEHGDSSVPVWSNVRIAGQPISMFEDLLSAEDRESIHQRVINSAQELISLKGYTSAGIGLAITDIVEAIVTNKNKILCATTLINGEYGVEGDVFASLPCMIGGNGISHIIPIQLTDEERQKFVMSINILNSAQVEIEKFLYP